MCEIGCGTGYVPDGLKSFHNLTLSGSEIYVEGLKYARKRLPGVEFFQADATELPVENYYDAIGAFDVLEHIDADKRAIESVYKSLKSDGYFFITVPQFQWMWSREDDVAFHKRRYAKEGLAKKLKDVGFQILFINSFVATLFPFMVFQRLIGRITSKQNSTATQGLRLPFLLNKVFYFLMFIDLALIKVGISLPWGGSLVCVVRKK